MSPDRDPLAHRPWRYRFAILAGTLLVLTLVHYATVSAPIQQRISHLHQQIQSARSEMLKHEQSRARVPKIEHQLAQLRNELAERRSMIADVSDHPVLLEEVSKRAQTAGLNVVRFRPGEERQRERYTELPLELNLDGTFGDFILFLRELAKTPQLSRVGNLTILSHDTVSRRMPLEIFLEILTYRVPPQFDQHHSQPLVGTLASSKDKLVTAKIERLPTGGESLGTLRDPFHPSEVSSCDESMNGLQNYDLNELQLVGVVWEPHDPKGLVMDGAQLAHIIIPGSLIGNRGGIVKAITPTHVIVEENLPDGANAARSMGLKFPPFTSTSQVTHDDPKTGEQGEPVNGKMGEREKSPRSRCAPRP